MPKEKPTKGKGESEPPVKWQRKRRKESYSGGGRRGGGREGGGAPGIRNRSPTPPNASEITEGNGSETSDSYLSYSSSGTSGSSCYTSSSGSSSSVSNSEDSQVEPEGAATAKRAKLSCCHHRHHRHHRLHRRRHHHHSPPRHHSHRPDHGRSSKRLSGRVSRRGAAPATKTVVVVNEEMPTTSGSHPVTNQIPTPILAELTTQPQPVPAPVPAPAPAPVPVSSAPLRLEQQHHQRKSRMRCSSSQAQAQAEIPAKTITITITNSLSNAGSICAADTVGAPPKAKIMAGGARSSGMKVVSISSASPMVSKSSSQVRNPVTSGSTAKAPVKTSQPNSSARHADSNGKSPMRKDTSNSCNSKMRASNGERPRRCSSTPPGPGSRRQGESGRNKDHTGNQCKQRRNDFYEEEGGSGGGRSGGRSEGRSGGGSGGGSGWGGGGGVGSGGGGRSGGGGSGRGGGGGERGGPRGGGPYDHPNAVGNQTDYRNGKHANKKLRQPVRSVRLHIRGLTRQVRKEHLTEIFGHFGALKAVDFPMDRLPGRLGRDYAFVEYARPEDCAYAIKLMNGGHIDGRRVTVSAFQENMPKAPWRHNRRPSPVNYRRQRQRHCSPSRSRSRSRSMSRSQARSPFSRGRSSPRYGKYHRPGWHSP